MAAADKDGAKVAAVIDRLAETLPKTADGKPYLAVFALTHADKDHCQGFGDLLDSKIVIGEVWATPRMWREFADEEQLMCPDAVRFHEEAERRVAATLQAVDNGVEPASGDRVRIIGYDFDVDDYSYSGLPDKYLSIPGQAITMIDGDDVADRFEAFIHAPFKDDCAESRNDTSLAMQITLRDQQSSTEGYLMLFGDLAYTTIKKIFNYSSARRPERLRWDVMLAAHHCSKKVMYPIGDSGEEFKRDILDDFEKYARSEACVVASSLPFPDSDKPSANPPHVKARDRYEEIAPSGVLCTGEYPNADAPRPIVFGLVAHEGLRLVPVEAAITEAKSASGSGWRSGGGLLAALGATVAVGTAAAVVGQRRGLDDVESAVKQARGADAAPATAVGFGR